MTPKLLPKRKSGKNILTVLKSISVLSGISGCLAQAEKKIKEHITKVDFLFADQWSIRRDLWKMEDTHKEQTFMYNQSFNDHYQSDRSQTDQYIRYLIRLFVNRNFKLNNTTLLRFAIKLNIEFDNEINRREEAYFNWKVDTYENINMFFQYA